ncbi:hypothetical protein [Dyadobacter koreensis]|nr:hypothetical protein [Dyadobacter koreensis]
MFKFIELPNSELAKISRIRRQSPTDTLQIHNLIGGEESQDLSFPHATFTLGLDELKNIKSPVPHRTGTRVIETSSSKFNFIYDLNNTAEGSEPQMYQDKLFVKSYETAFKTILNQDTENQSIQVRTLRIPALHIDALWLHDAKSPAKDKFVPVRSQGLFNNNSFYNRKDFFSILKRTAIDYNIDDDLMGG